MARLTPAQLQAAKKEKEEQRRAQEEAEEQRDAWLHAAREQLNELDVVVGGIYDELDKLARKWPTMPVTERTVTRTNKALTAVRGLLDDEDDEFLDGLGDIVPAGDMPETRDVLMTLREAKDALSRFRKRYASEWTALDRSERGW